MSPREWVAFTLDVIACAVFLIAVFGILFGLSDNRWDWVSIGFGCAATAFGSFLLARVLDRLNRSV